MKQTHTPNLGFFSGGWSASYQDANGNVWLGFEDFQSTTNCSDSGCTIPARGIGVFGSNDFGLTQFGLSAREINDVTAMVIRDDLLVVTDFANWKIEIYNTTTRKHVGRLSTARTPTMFEEPRGVAFAPDGTLLLALTFDREIRTCNIVPVPPTPAPATLAAPTFTQRGAEPEVEFDSLGGQIAGWILIGLAPILVILAFIGYRGIEKKTKLQPNPTYNGPATGAAGAAVLVSSNRQKAVLTIIWIFIYLIVLAGIGLLGYAIYDTYLFATEDFVGAPNEGYGEEQDRVSAWLALDCSIEDDPNAPPRCICEPSGGVWACRMRDPTDPAGPFDCSVDASPLCNCVAGERAFYQSATTSVGVVERWSCSKRAAQPAEFAVDTGARFIPPNSASQFGLTNATTQETYFQLILAVDQVGSCTY